MPKVTGEGKGSFERKCLGSDLKDENMFLERTRNTVIVIIPPSTLSFLCLSLPLLPYKVSQRDSLRLSDPESSSLAPF